MEGNNELKYFLAIKRDKNDYLPLEWDKFSFYRGQNMSTLEGIDSFTSILSESELLIEAVNLGFVEMSDKCLNVCIIFFENGKWRELKEGATFIDTHCIGDGEFVPYIYSRSDDKVFINNVVNMFNKGFTSLESQQLLYVLKNLDIFRVKGDNYLRVALDVFSKMPYNERRKLRKLVSHRSMIEVLKNEKIYKKNNNDTI